MDPEDVIGVPSPFTIDPGATNPQLAQQFLNQHRGDMQQRQGEIDAGLNKMQLNADDMAKILDETTAALKASRNGQINTPLMAMGAAMLASNGNFGQQLGAGLGAMVPAIHQQRKQEDEFQSNLANLALKKAQVQNMPLEAKLAYMRALQTGDQAAVRAIEQALIRSQTGGSRQANEQQKLVAKAVQNALEEARKQVDMMGKEMYADAGEREAEIQRRFLENIKIHRASGIQIPDEVLAPFIKTGGGAQPSGTIMSQRKSYFDVPQGAEREKRTLDAGLPAEPTGYIYDMVGPKERPEILKKQAEAWQKQTKDWGTESEKMTALGITLDRMDEIATRKPEIFGYQFGVIPNKYSPNMYKDAQLFQSLSNAMQIHNVPQGQGAVSNMERELFQSQSPNLGVGAEVNKQLIGIAKEMVKRDKDRREFFSQYFNNYKTSDGMVEAWDRYINSPAGSAFIRGQDGSIKANINRQSWREFFRKERGANGYRDGGYVKLGAEYD